MSKAERAALKGGEGTPPTADKKKDYDYILKLLLIGDVGVGKTCIMRRFVGETLNSHSTIGFDFKVRTVEINREKVKLQIWDTPSQERFRSMTATYFRGSHGVIVVYDVNNAESFENVKSWLRFTNEHCCEDVCRILVGGRNDDPDRKRVETTEAYMLAEQLGINLFETSAKAYINVEEAFIFITELIVRAKKENLAKQKITTPTERSIGDWLREHQQRLQTAFDGARDRLLAAAHRRKERHDE